MKNTFCHLMGLVSLLLSGCASEKLSLKLDIYREKPDTPIFTSGDVAKLYHNIDLTRKAAKDFAVKRINIAQQMVEFYEALMGASKAQDDVPLNNAKKHLSNYEDAINKQLGAVLLHAQASRKAVDQYAKSSDNADVPLLSQEFQEFEGSVSKLAGSLGTDFEGGFGNVFAGFLGNLESLESDTPKETLEKLRQRFQNVLEAVDVLAKDGSATMVKLKEQLELLSGAIAANNVVDRTKALPKSAEWNAATVNTELAPSTTRSLDRIVKQLTPAAEWADLERLQDPADPVWRVLTDPKNARKWDGMMATNLFYAEGNSGVIVVRDSPIRYRVQRGNNNPAALVQSQLQITRAVADAAIQVAGAVSGVKIPVTSSDAGSRPATQEIGESGTAQKAAIEERARKRDAAIRYLQTQLTSIHSRLSKAGLSEEEQKRLLRELRSLLDGVKPIFKPPTTQ